MPLLHLVPQCLHIYICDRHVLRHANEIPKNDIICFVCSMVWISWFLWKGQSWTRLTSLRPGIAHMESNFSLRFWHTGPIGLRFSSRKPEHQSGQNKTHNLFFFSIEVTRTHILSHTNIKSNILSKGNFISKLR